MVLSALGAPGPAVPVRLLLAGVYAEATESGSESDRAVAMAALDRSLRRLEARGLVVRHARRAGTAAVSATAEGFRHGRLSRNRWKWRECFSGDLYLTRHRLELLQDDSEQ